MQKVAANPEKSVIYGIQEDTEYTFEDVSDSISKSQIAVLVIMAAGFGILIYGLSKKGWYFEEMSGLFIFMGIACGLVSGYGPSRIAKEFGNGAKGIVVGCLIIGIARTVEVILSDAKFLIQLSMELLILLMLCRVQLKQSACLYASHLSIV